MIIHQVKSMRDHRENAYEFGFVGPPKYSPALYGIVLNTSDRKYWSNYEDYISTFKLEIIF